MKIREAQSSDINNLTILFDTYRMFYGKESDLDSGKKFLTERLTQGDSKIYVAENQEKELTGFVQLYPLLSSTRLKKLWLLNDLFVAAQFRGQGISKLLIERAKQLCYDTNACGLTLETEKSNDIGNSLYPSAGFILDVDNNFYYWNS